MAEPWRRGNLTPMRTPVRADVAQVDDMFGAEAVDEAREAVSLYATDGKHQGLDPRRRDGQERIQRHGTASTVCGSRAYGHVEGRSR